VGITDLPGHPWTRITAETLKEKAVQIGRSKDVTENPQSGSLTVTVEV
jgi:hypothetical protein